MESNISLIHNNAKVGAKIAVELKNLQKKSLSNKIKFGFSSQKKNIVVIGGSAVDYRMKPMSGRNL